MCNVHSLGCITNYRMYSDRHCQFFFLRTYVKGMRKECFKIIKGQLLKWVNIKRKRCRPLWALRRYVDLGNVDI